MMSLKTEYKILADRNVRQSGYEIHSTINKKIYDQMQKTKDEYEMYGVHQNENRDKDPETGKEERWKSRFRSVPS